MCNLFGERGAAEPRASIPAPPRLGEDVGHPRSIEWPRLATDVRAGASFGSAGTLCAPEAAAECYHVAGRPRQGSHEMRAFAIILAAAVTAACSPALAQGQTDLDNLAGKRVAPEIGTTGYNIATEERRHAAYPRRHWHARPPISHSRKR